RPARRCRPVREGGSARRPARGRRASAGGRRTRRTGPSVRAWRHCASTRGRGTRARPVAIGDNGRRIRRVGWLSRASGSVTTRMRCPMAAVKPRTVDGQLELTTEGRGIVMRVPLEDDGRLVVERNADEAGALGDALKEVVG